MQWENLPHNMHTTTRALRRGKYPDTTQEHCRQVGRAEGRLGMQVDPTVGFRAVRKVDLVLTK